MTPRHCEREPEVAAAVRRGRLSVQDEEVQHHVSQCAACADVARVSEALAADLEAVRMLLEEGPLPSAGQVWRRAALRARAEGVQSAYRPLAWALGLAGAVVAGLTIAAVGAAWPTLAEAFGRVVSALVPPGHVTDGVGRILGEVLPGRWAVVIGGAGVCLALMPVAVYLAVRDGRRL